MITEVTALETLSSPPSIVSSQANDSYDLTKSPTKTKMLQYP